LIVEIKLGSALPQARRLCYDFNRLGRQTRDRVTSFDNATVGSGLIVSDVRFGYNSYNRLSQLTADYQFHSGAVNMSSSPKKEGAMP
jgi:hypothetical protein